MLQNWWAIPSSERRHTRHHWEHTGGFAPWNWRLRWASWREHLENKCGVARDTGKRKPHLQKVERMREEWVHDGFWILGGSYFCRAARPLRPLHRRKCSHCLSEAIPCISWASFIEETGHVTGWRGEGALPGSPVVCRLSPEYPTTVWPPPLRASIFSWMTWGLHGFLSVLVPWLSEIIFKAEKKNQVTTENRFQSLLGCKVGPETEPGIEKEFEETFEKRYWRDRGSIIVQVNAELKLPKSKRWITGEIWGRREKTIFRSIWKQMTEASPGWGELLREHGGQRQTTQKCRVVVAADTHQKAWAHRRGLCLLGRRCRCVSRAQGACQSVLCV